MQVLLPIREATPPGAPSRPSWRAFTEMGFRPLYLLGCAWALVSVLLWIHAPGLLRGDLGGVFWHGHEMLWAFVGTIAVGFLLTAGGNWTGHNPLRGNALAALCALWLVARVWYLVPGRPAFWVATAADLAFFLWAAAALGRSVWRSRNKRNYGVPLMLLALALTHLVYALGVVRGDYPGLMRGLNAGLLSMAVLTLLIARRIIPFFAGRAVAGLTIPPHTRSGHLQIAAGVIAIAMLLAGMNTLAALALAASGAIAIVQWVAWKPWAVRRVPLLWILYAGYLGLGVGLLVGAAHLAGAVAWGAWHVHTIGVAGFSVLIIGMVTRTALGHLGRPLRTDKSMVVSYVLMLMAALLRLAALWPQAPAVPLLHASATAWVLALGLYLWRFTPWMIRPRA